MGNLSHTKHMTTRTKKITSATVVLALSMSALLLIAFLLARFAYPHLSPGCEYTLFTASTYDCTAVSLALYAVIPPVAIVCYGAAIRAVEGKMRIKQLAFRSIAVPLMVCLGLIALKTLHDLSGIGQYVAGAVVAYASHFATQHAAKSFRWLR